MQHWKAIIDIGHTAWMLPLAAAVAAWMVSLRAGRMALCWCAMFAVGIGIVAASKIAYLGWEAGIPSLGFKALSGHALCATAVLPVCLFVVLRHAANGVRRASVGIGISTGIGIGILMVHFGFHSASEVIASTFLGLSISMGFMRIAGKLPMARIGPWTVPLSVAVFALAFALKPAIVNHRLVGVALHLSGREHPVEWPRKMMCKSRTAASG